MPMTPSLPPTALALYRKSLDSLGRALEVLNGKKMQGRAGYDPRFFTV